MNQLYARKETKNYWSELILFFLNSMLYNIHNYALEINYYVMKVFLFQWNNSETSDVTDSMFKYADIVLDLLKSFYLSTNSITINYSRIKLHIGILIHSYRYIWYYPLVFLLHFYKLKIYRKLTFSVLSLHFLFFIIGIFKI